MLIRLRHKDFLGLSSGGQPKSTEILGAGQLFDLYSLKIPNSDTLLFMPAI